MGIKNRYSTLAYPQGNGQAKAVNKVIVNGLKKSLDIAQGKWVEELPHVLWTYQTTPHRSTRETLFSMTYGTEAVISMETGFLMLKTGLFALDSNDKSCTRAEHAGEMNSHATWSTTGQKSRLAIKLARGLNSRLSHVASQPCFGKTDSLHSILTPV